MKRKNLQFVVPQESQLGPYLLKICVEDISLVIYNATNLRLFENIESIKSVNDFYGIVYNILNSISKRCLKMI